MMWGNPYGGGGGFGWIAMIASSLFGLLVIVGIVLLIVWAVRGSEHAHAGPQHRYPQSGGWANPPTQTRDPAVDAARERYARGEITKEQLDQILRDLGYNA